MSWQSRLNPAQRDCCFLSFSVLSVKYAPVAKNTMHWDCKSVLERGERLFAGRKGLYAGQGPRQYHERKNRLTRDQGVRVKVIGGTGSRAWLLRTAFGFCRSK